MAFSSSTKRKEVKKSSYYVWFLGAKESRGLRGEDYVWPAVHYLTERENDVEPIKVTLQVSGKGLKIIQNGSRATSGVKGSKCETSKHFIPDHSITCVVQDVKPNDDIVAAILLLFNPVSKCPVHVHAYRCDSVETATVLRQHLQALVERPENQRKFVELERRLQAKGLLPPSSSLSPPSSLATTTATRLNSDGRSVRTESDSSGGGSDIYALDERMSNLYDSLAAELREKLNNKKNNGPLLLPPRDYDTVHRQRGNVGDVAVSPASGQPKRGKDNGPGYGGELDSSGKSSGIGSDEAPSSPTHERSGQTKYRNVAAPAPATPSRNKNPHDDSSSDDDWERQRRNHPRMTDDDMVLVQSPRTGGPRPGGHGRQSPSPPSSMHPPSPKPPPYRQRYYEGERTTGNRSDRKGGTSSSDGPAGFYGDRNGDFPMHRTKCRSSTQTADDYNPPRDVRPLRRVKSRDDKDYVPCSKRDSGYRSRSDRDPFGSRDSAVAPACAPHPHLSHSRSHDLLSSATDDAPPRRDNGHRYRLGPNGDQWPGDRDPRAKSPPLVAPSPKPSPVECNGYVPLPRIRRVDSGHSSGNTPHSNGHHRASATTAVSYQELPDEKRYPGLDRDTARVHQHAQLPGHVKARDYDRREAWDSRERDCPRYDYPPVMQKLERATGHPAGVARPSPGLYLKDKIAGVPPAAQPTHKLPVASHHANNSADDKRFHRYSSSDPDCRYSGRKVAAAGYHY